MVNDFYSKKPNAKIKKHIRITDQCSQYMDNECNSSWFNTGTEDVEIYGIKVVDDVSMLLVNGGISDEEQDVQDFLDISIDPFPHEDKKEFNEVKQLKNKLKI